MGVVISIQNRATASTFTSKQLFNLWWSLRYQALFHYNRSPWVEHGYCAPVDEVELILKGEVVPGGAWNIELLDVSTEPGALGWHEDKNITSSAHSARGKAADTELPLAKVFCKTSREAGVQPSEVVSHEMLEMLVDPWVTDESQLRVYTNPADSKEYIGEVGDPVQEEGYDVGQPEGRPAGVPEAIVANFAYPAWWGQPQTRPERDFRGTRKAAFELAPGGYMSIRSAGGEWEQIYGADRLRAEANAHAYAGPDEKA